MTSRPRSARRAGRATVGAGIAVLALAAFAAFATMGSASGVSATQAQYAPVNTVAPTISGTATEKQVLTANDGTWTGSPKSFAYQWLRCDGAGNACGDISGANAKTYTLQGADVSKTIRVRVTGSNNDGKASVTSGQTAAVASAGPAGAIKLPNGDTSIPASSVNLANGQRLIITDVQFTPNPVKVRSHNPITVRVRVKDNRGYVVRDVLVFVRSTPLVTSTPPEQATQQDGWVTLTTVPQANFPTNPSYNVQVFVRARKSGDDPLGGASTRRLVQFSLTR